MTSSPRLISIAVLRRWVWLHKWCSLVCTLFLLMLCVTGLPLIFHEEIEAATSKFEPPAPLPKGAPAASLDRIAASVLAQKPGKAIHFLFQDADRREIMFASVGQSPDAPLDQAEGLMVDAGTAKVLGEQPRGGFVEFLFKLHVELFAGLPGKLFLGFMAGLFLVAIASGVVLYAPFMRERAYGVVRREKGARLRWLDLHNLLGISTLVWVLAVGATGMINTWADLAIKRWQFTEMNAMTAQYRGQAPPKQLSSVQAAVDVAQSVEPGLRFAFVAYPGNLFSSPHHYAVFMRGSEPLTARLIKPVLIDAETGQFTDKREMPWYIKAILISQPLHFGDYGGWPLKVLWAIFDLAAIAVLWSGVVLWWKRRRVPVQIDFADESEAIPAILEPAQ